MKKNIPEIREWEGNEKIHSHNLGTGIRGFFSWEREFPLTPANWSPAIWAPRRFGGKLGPMPIGNTQTLGPGGCFLGLGGIGRP